MMNNWSAHTEHAAAGLPLRGACCVPDNASIEVVKSLTRKFSNTSPEKSMRKTGVCATIKGGEITSSAMPHCQRSGAFQFILLDQMSH